jgi:hypothetical protein
MVSQPFRMTWRVRGREVSRQGPDFPEEDGMGKEVFKSPLHPNSQRPNE